MNHHYLYSTNNSQATISSIQSSVTIVAYILFATFLSLLFLNHFLGATAILHPLSTARGLMQLGRYKFNDAMARSKKNEDHTSPQGGDWKGFQEEMRNLTSEMEQSNSTATGEGPVNDGESEGEYFKGLLNAGGNLCYLNSVLQSMASTQKLTTSLASLPLPVSSSLYALLTALNTPSHRQSAPLRPIELAKVLAASSKSRARLLASSEQQDAHELWGMIISAVDDEFVQRNGEVAESVGRERDQGKARAKLRNPYEHLIAQSVECLVCGYTRDIRLVPELLTTLVLPAVSSITLEQCLEEYTRMDPISEYMCRRCAMMGTYNRLVAQRDRLASIAPPTPPSLEQQITRDPTSVLLDSLTPPTASISASTTTSSKSKKNRLREVKKLLEKVRCAVDASDFEREIEGIRIERILGPAGKMINFARTPEILAFHFNRSTQFSRSGAAYKNTCQVIFPEILDLSRFASNASLARGSSNPTASMKDGSGLDEELYRLTSLVVHYGSHHYGHYITFRRRPNSSASRLNNTSDMGNEDRVEWYRASDETVDPARIEEVLRANPFMLFYERVDRAPVPLSLALASSPGDTNGTGIIARVVQSWGLKDLVTEESKKLT